MLKMNLMIESPEDAIHAQKVLSAYVGETSSTTVAEKPKKEVKETPKKEVKAVVEKDETEEVEEETTETDKDSSAPVTLKELTDTAKEAVARTDRATVKEVIGEFGDKLSTVNEADYAELVVKLENI